MAIIFYDHLIDKAEINIYVDSIEASPQKKRRLKKHVDDILHHGILDFILKKLDSKKHRPFLNQLEHAPFDPELLSYLKDHIDQKIETEIRQEANRIVHLIKKDLNL